MSWTVEQTGPTVTTIRIPVYRSPEWSQWMLVTADRHLDSPKSDRAMQKRHLQQAAERNAFVVDCGDLYDAMQGRDDRRGSKGDLRSEQVSSDYLGSLIRTGVDFLAPYSKQLALLGLGNHETAVLSRKEFDLTRMLVERLRDQGAQVVLGGYRGWLRLLFSDADGHGHRSSLKVAYMHGGGGGGAVTRGAIKTNRRAVIYPDADIIVSGHTHESFAMSVPRTRLSDSGREYRDEQIHLHVPSYKDATTGHGGGFEVEKEHNPKPVGAWWVRFFRAPGSGIKFEYTAAR